MTTRRDILHHITSSLIPLYAATEAAQIARIVTSELGHITLSELLSDPLVPLEIEGLDQKLEALQQGCPVQYLLGHTEFYGLDFAIRAGALIPRPETEELVDWVAKELPTTATVLDIGTGCGAIALTMKHLRPDATVFGVDISAEALSLARENAIRLGVEVAFTQADVFQGLSDYADGSFDAIVSNPPYIPQSDLATMHPNVTQYEPHVALFVPDDDPLLFYRTIARTAQRLLKREGSLYFEIYERAEAAMREMLTQEGFTAITLRHDLNDKPRMICCQR
ncbi:MAG: peptide chain release factor N(5)-glutamine methyltransferase [Alistipes sp.]